MLESIKELLMDGVTSPVVVSLVVGGIMALIHSLVKGKAALVDAIMAKAVEMGVEVLSRTAPNTENKIDDEVLVFLKAFKAYFEAHGLIATPKVEAKALEMFKALKALPEVK
jgi:hypothetical protein